MYAGSMHPASSSWMRWTASAVSGVTAVVAVAVTVNILLVCTVQPSRGQ